MLASGQLSTDGSLHVFRGMLHTLFSRADPEPDRIHRGQEDERNDRPAQRAADQRPCQRAPEYRMRQGNERQHGRHGGE